MWLVYFGVSKKKTVPWMGLASKETNNSRSGLQTVDFTGNLTEIKSNAGHTVLLSL